MLFRIHTFAPRISGVDATREKLVSPEEVPPTKAELKCAMPMENGEQCVMTVGLLLKRVLCAGSSDIRHAVSTVSVGLVMEARLSKSVGFTA